MTTFTSPMAAPTYARGRLTVGITGVGTVVVLSILALIIDVPTRLFGDQGGTFLKDIPLFALWLGGVSLVSLPFEWLGGLAVPAAHRRAHPNADQWVSSWLRGTLLLLSIGSLCGAAIALGGRSGGFVGAIGVAGLTALALLAIQGPLALLIGGLQTVRPPQNALTDALSQLGLERLPLQFVDAKDEGFTGSIVGLPTAETHVLPASWLADFTPQALASIIARRAAAVDFGLRARGLMLAFGWFATTFAIASQMPGAGVDSVAALCSTSLWFTLLTFVGLLVLPTPSRRATLAADAHLIQKHPEVAGTWAETLRAQTADRTTSPDAPRASSASSIPSPTSGHALMPSDGRQQPPHRGTQRAPPSFGDHRALSAASRRPLQRGSTRALDPPTGRRLAAHPHRLHRQRAPPKAAHYRRAREPH